MYLETKPSNAVTMSVTLDAWLTGEAINGADVVVWYGAHFTHDISHEQHGHFGHIVGPDLRRVKGETAFWMIERNCVRSSYVGARRGSIGGPG